ncbi:conserved protein of unknown function [Georgfuchsia toluolica]|uniref:Phage protein n=1 Tax=Georgfuchsia toluolica TaxID=424218 RepID=A0A916J4G6_9PROT|nr:hypothetical protein [Georgfuchsia toluolica]CAG4883801.1 conserved protein of unknown function [Georgfuchsia toluolica]
MLKIKVDTSGLMRLRAEIEGKAKQVRYATMRSLNAAAYKASQDTAKEIARVFDRPTPWVLRSVRYVKATRDRLEASVDFDFWGNKQGVTVSQVLNAEIHGGGRRLKRYEVALQRAGILPAGMAAVPGAAAKMDQYGNMSSGQIVQIMAWFQSFGEQGYKANINQKGRNRLMRGSKRGAAPGFAYFVLKQRQGKLLPGIYQRFNFSAWGTAVKPVMIFVRIPQYRRRLDFYGLAEKSARAEFDAQFPRQLDEAMRTAR